MKETEALLLQRPTRRPRRQRQRLQRALLTLRPRRRLHRPPQQQLQKLKRLARKRLVANSKSVAVAVDGFGTTLFTKPR
jgi:hypothetical protein